MNDSIIILAIVFGAIVLLAFLIWLGSYIAKKRKISKTGIDEEKGVRYSADTDIGTAEDPNMTYVREDILIPQNTTEFVGKKNKVKSGKYTILSTIDSMESFYVRIGAYVRGVKHGSEIILAEGEKITPVSCSIILR